ncbi:type III polyketide synthase [Frankia sp. Cr1]|uniref:type III polyketide synthase n=1 Tax=Frankia sp. Cr1 TaxID=3073931 RepID=UPI002AD30D98|nr:type III polyketide synthase [Frankia sp. Cr1]
MPKATATATATATAANRMHTAVLTGQGTAFPPPMGQQALWDDVFARRYNGNQTARRIFLGCGVSTRHGVIDPRVEDVSEWTTGTRMRRYVTAAHPLGREAVLGALTDAGLHPADVGLFVVVSCTGYATPGLDIALAAELGMPPTTQRLFIGHMGCYAALPALSTATDYVRVQGRPAVVLCVELPSLHVQPFGPRAERDVEQIVAHALFGDAACAVVLEPDVALEPDVHGGVHGGLEVVDTEAVTDPASASLMTWTVTDHGFRMSLSAKVPDVLALHVEKATRALLGRHGLDVDDIAGWAIHPGGPRIVNVVAEKLGLRADQTAASQEILDTRGNCSSATVPLVLQQIRQNRQLRPGDPVVAMAFGPGLTLWNVLLKAR